METQQSSFGQHQKLCERKNESHTNYSSQNIQCEKQVSSIVCRNPPQLHESDQVRSDGCGGEQLLS